MRKVLATGLSLAVMAGSIGSNVWETDAGAVYEEVSGLEKITDLLAQEMELEQDTYHVMVWMRDIDYDEVMCAAETAAETSWESIEAAEKRVYHALLERTAQPMALYTVESRNVFDEQAVSELDMLGAQVNELIAGERCAAKERYETQNADALKTYGLAERVEYVSQYAPAFVADLSKEQIVGLCSEENVEWIDLWTEPAYSADMEELTVEAGAVMSVSDTDTSYMDYMNVRYLKKAFSGQGVKVGLLDGTAINPNDHPELYDSCIYPIGERAIDDAQAIHPTQMARIICGKNGIAPDCTMYSMGQGSGQTYMSTVERLISQGVTIINNSMNYSKKRNQDAYTSVEKWVDHVAANHNVTFVKSAGNILRDGLSDITMPGLAYNVITVANYDYKNDCIASNSCYGTAGGCQKPDVAAPGVDVLGNSGTSPAAACVTGMIALLMQSRPSIARSPHVVKAIVIASCDRLAGTSAFGNAYYAKEGAGIVNAGRAVAIASNGQYYLDYITTDGISVEKRITLGLNASKHTYVFVGLKLNSASGQHKADDYSNIDMAKVNLTVLTVSGTKLGNCYMPNSSVQLVRSSVDADQMNIRLDFSSVSNRGIPYALAWY